MMLLSDGASVVIQGHDAVSGFIVGITGLNLADAFVSGQRAQRCDLDRKVSCFRVCIYIASPSVSPLSSTDERVQQTEH